MSLQRSERDKEISFLAEAVANDFGEENAVDPEKILQDVGIGFVFNSYGQAFDALLEHEDGEFFVYANKDRGNLRGSPKGRFTLAHELGHYFIDEHRRAVRDEIGMRPSMTGLFDSSSCSEEREADLFAASLLMPPTRFLKKLKTNETPLSQIKNVANHFRTSLTSSALQFVSLSDTPAAVISWDPDGNLRWRRVSDEWRKDERCKFCRKTKFQNREELLPDSASSRVLSGKEEEEERAITASQVFKNVASGGFRDDVLREECFKLGEYGFLTIYTPHPNF